MLRTVYYKLSPEWRMIARKVYYFPEDFITKFQKKNTITPPKGDIYIGSGDYIAQGKSHLYLLKKYIALLPKDHVLDIGCGIGRTATALTSYLNSSAKYVGFDVVKKGIDWCKKNIESNYSNFHFDFVPLHNSLYNSHLEKSTDFTFPYPNESFDKVYLFSVFTHMKIEDIQHYLSEISRVLKNEGQCLMTSFTYQEKEYQSGTSNFKFKHKKEGYRLFDSQLEEANIAIEMDKLNEMIYESKLELINKIPGFWNNQALKSKDNDFQDILILRKMK